MSDQEVEQKLRGEGRGSNFFALGRDVWEALWAVPTTNRMNLVITYLVLLAGTGSDHRLTKWSAKACEDHVGLGKPRAKAAIDQLVECGMIARTPASTRNMPQYELPALPLEADPIFMPNALVTGLASEASMLRRLKEAGDPLALRMLVDLYGLVCLDATHGIPLEMLRGGLPEDEAPNAKQIATVGAHSVWALHEGNWRHAAGDWRERHRVASARGKDEWVGFWSRLELLTKIGAVWFEPWLFDSDAIDADPLFPLDQTGFYNVQSLEDEARLTKLAAEAAQALVGDRTYLFDHHDATYFVPLNLHRQAPALRMVARLRVEADTPGRRRSWAQRRKLIEGYLGGFHMLLKDATAGHFDKPMRVHPVGELV
jgi:hypothetical protein